MERGELKSPMGSLGVATTGIMSVVMFSYATGGLGWEVHGTNVEEVGAKVKEVFRWCALNSITPGNGSAQKKDKEKKSRY